MTGTGVLLKFVFPFDRTMPREASIVWRRTIGGETVDTPYAAVSQSGDSCIVHEQITFSGDCWAAVEKGTSKLLALYVATGEREQRVVISSDSRRAATAVPSEPVPPSPPPQQPPHPADEDEDADLAAAIRESLRTNVSSGAAGAASSSSAAVDGAGSSAAAADDDAELDEALALSRRLAEEHRRRATAP